MQHEVCRCGRFWGGGSTPLGTPRCCAAVGAPRFWDFWNLVEILCPLTVTPYYPKTCIFVYGRSICRLDPSICGFQLFLSSSAPSYTPTFLTFSPPVSEPLQGRLLHCHLYVLFRFLSCSFLPSAQSVITLPTTFKKNLSYVKVWLIYSIVLF